MDGEKDVTSITSWFFLNQVPLLLFYSTITPTGHGESGFRRFQVLWLVVL